MQQRGLQLPADTSYTFYARLKETANYNASSESAGFTTTTNKAALDGTVSTDGNAVYGETLTADTTSLTSTPSIADLGQLVYQWKRGSASIPGATEISYTISSADDIGAVINVTVTAMLLESLRV